MKIKRYELHNDLMMYGGKNARSEALTNTGPLPLEKGFIFKLVNMYYRWQSIFYMLFFNWSCHIRYGYFFKKSHEKHRAIAFMTFRRNFGVIE